MIFRLASKSSFPHLLQQKQKVPLKLLRVDGAGVVSNASKHHGRPSILIPGRTQNTDRNAYLRWESEPDDNRTQPIRVCVPPDRDTGVCVPISYLPGASSMLVDVRAKNNGQETRRLRQQSRVLLTGF